MAKKKQGGASSGQIKQSCPICERQLDYVGGKVVKYKKTEITAPLYFCRSCNKKYTSLTQFPHMANLKIGEESICNINKAWIKPEVNHTNKKILYVYGVHKPTKCRVDGCCGNLERLQLKYTDSNEKTSYFLGKQCQNCGSRYLPYGSFALIPAKLRIQNADELDVITQGLEKRREERRKRREEKRAKKIEEQQILEQKRNEQIQKEKEAQRLKEELLSNINKKSRLEQGLRQKNCGASDHQVEIRKENNLNMISQYNKQLNEQNKAVGKTKRDSSISQIVVTDFVVKRSVFMCMHRNHKLINIDGRIGIINQKGNVEYASVTAGYCPECNVYFIMESIFQLLKKRGTLICRLTDEKVYLKGNTYLNGMQLAQESILKQYGYTVAENEGLSEIRRRKILALLIDNQILSKGEVISYLDFFINQRKNLSKYEKSVDKWESDREFVSEYRKGTYEQVGISGLSRRY